MTANKLVPVSDSFTEWVAEPAPVEPADKLDVPDLGSSVPVTATDQATVDRERRIAGRLSGFGKSANADQVADTLGVAVRIATDGAADRGRPGQIHLARDIWRSLQGDGDLVASAPTGTGKSLAYGVALGVAAAVRGERSIISTESLALQAQLITKDLPVVAAAVEEVFGENIGFAVLKGRSNFACAEAVRRSAYKLLESAGLGVSFPDDKAMVDAIAANRSTIRKAKTVTVEHNDVPALALAKALEWAIPASVGVDPMTWEYPPPSHVVPGDFDSAGDSVDSSLRPLLSATSSTCIGTECLFFADCRAETARRDAANADIVVANHALLGVQAVRGIPAVNGSKRIGLFQHIVVDEAHALPGVVRSQGAQELSGRTLRSLVKALDNTSGGSPTGTKAAASKTALSQAGRHLADDLEEVLKAYVAGKDQRSFRAGDPVTIGVDDNPLDGQEVALGAWFGEVKAQLRSRLKEVETEMARLVGEDRAKKRPVLTDRSISLRRALGRSTDMAACVERAAFSVPGYARWIEPSADGTPAVQLSPVDVAMSLDSFVWSLSGMAERSMETTDDDIETSRSVHRGSVVASAGSQRSNLAGQDFQTCDGQLPTERLSVVALSATVPARLAKEAGIKAVTRRYESPFAESYRSSRLLLPALSQADRDRMFVSYNGSAPKFNTDRHREWAAEKIVELVRANSGRSLVLAATTAAGKHYVDALRSAGLAWTVRSQWDAGTTGRNVAAWRDEETSVMVGTRSLFTGVDAPGETCSLVVIDRAPRARANPVDDARRDQVCADNDIGPWEANTHIYVADAAVILEQGVGRLIRSTSDSGLVAVLDPRFTITGRGGYSTDVRRAYTGAFDAFTEDAHLHSVDDAVSFLVERRAGVTSPASSTAASK